MIKVHNLTKNYGSFKALDSISFEVKKGEIMGFLGPNGAGKTTTMKILAGYMPPTSGEAWINELSLEEKSLQIRQDIGYLPESNPLYTDFTVEEALKYVASMHRLSKSQLKEALERVVQQCSLESVYYRGLENLSKGFKQRVGLAQALVCDPQTLILDEPTVGLDPKQIIEIRDLIMKLGKNRTVLLSTHIMQEVQAICSKVTIINKGRIVAQGSPEELKEESEKKMMGVIYVKIEGAVKEIENALKKIKGVEHVETKDQEKKGIHGYNVEVKQGADVRLPIFEMAVKQGWKLYEITPERVSLEEVFLEVTKN
jgi:ABC-2 type transport system ATP-binding protein